MKLTTTIEWHNLLKNPDDLPSDSMDVIVAICDYRTNRVDVHAFSSSYFSYKKETGLFYYYDEDEYDDLQISWGKVVAWAEIPTFYDIEAALNKEILGKEV